MFYEPEYHADGTIAAMNRTRSDVPREVLACTITQDFDDIPLPTKPDRPLRADAARSHRHRNHARLPLAVPLLSIDRHQTAAARSLASKPSCRRPWKVTGTPATTRSACSASAPAIIRHFEELVNRMHEVFTPLGVNISLPSLRVNDQLQKLPQLFSGVRKAGLTLAPEVARDDMRVQIRKPIKNEDLYEGCRDAFKSGWQRVKLYFMCGLPGERQVDLDGIVDMAETISRIGKEVKGRFVEVTAAGVQLRAQAAYALSVERHADARIS